MALGKATRDPPRESQDKDSRDYGQGLVLYLYNVLIYSVQPQNKSTLFNSIYELFMFNLFSYTLLWKMSTEQEGFFRCQTPTSFVRLKVEAYIVKNGGCNLIILETKGRMQNFRNLGQPLLGEK